MSYTACINVQQLFLLYDKISGRCFIVASDVIDYEKWALK